jgi:hypothetical protein
MDNSEQSVIHGIETGGDIFCSCDRTASFTCTLPQIVTENFSVWRKVLRIGNEDRMRKKAFWRRKLKRNENERGKIST